MQTLSTELPRRHINPFHSTAETVFRAQVAELNRTIPELTAPQVYAAMQRIAASLRDAHTLVQLNATVGFRSLPVRFQMYDDGLYVVAVSPRYLPLLGSRVIAIGGRTIEEVFHSLRPFISFENEPWFLYQAPQYLVSRQFLQAANIVRDGDSITITAIDSGGRVVTSEVMEAADPPAATVADKATGFVPETFSRSGEKYWFHFDPEYRMLYLQYNQCQEDARYPFGALVSSLYGAMANQLIDTFVIDLRNNTGGDTSVIAPLTSSLGARLTALRRNPNFRFYVAISKATFSSGLLHAEELKANFGGVLIGEPTGGKPSSYGNVQSFTLPNSGLGVTYSTKYFPNTLFRGIPDASSLSPDLPVPMRGADILARHDPYRMAMINRAYPPLRPADNASIAILNAASYRPEAALAPGLIAALFGDFGTENGRSVTIGGQDAMILAESQTQINAVLPMSLVSGRNAVRVERAGVSIAEGAGFVEAVSPGLFLLPSAEEASRGAVLNEDSTLNGKEHPAKPGSVIQVFGTGFNLSTPPRFFVAESEAPVLHSGPVNGFPGLWQLNVQLPAGVTMTGAIPVVAAAGGMLSNPVVVRIGPARIFDEFQNR